MVLIQSQWFVLELKLYDSNEEDINRADDKPLKGDCDATQRRRASETASERRQRRVQQPFPEGPFPSLPRKRIDERLPSLALEIYR